MQYELLKCFMFGLTIALAIGPIAILIIQKGISYGAKPAVFSGIGAALCDGTYALIAFFASAAIIHPIIENKNLIANISSVILLAFGCWIIFEAFKNKNKVKIEKKSSLKSAHHLFSTYLLTLSNPMTIIVFIGFAGQTKYNLSFWHGVVLSAAVFIGSLIVQIAIALTGVFFGNIAKKGNLPFYLNVLSGCVIAFFGFLHFII